MNRYISLLFQICIALFWGTILSILISRNKNVNMTINELKYETFLTLDLNFWLKKAEKLHDLNEKLE